MNQQRTPSASREVVVVALLVGAVLFALSGRYGYHRDELYFLAAGKHLAWGYPDQPPLVPLLARLADMVAPGSLMVLRLPATCAAAVVIVLTGVMARNLGARRGGQILAAVAASLSGIVLASGHLLSTTAIALLGWVTLTYLLVGLLAGRASRARWIGLGVVAGLTFQANPLVVAFLLVLGCALLVTGPRDVARSAGPYLAGTAALFVAFPYVLWQATHGWPQLEVAAGIANGDSGSSTSRLHFIPLQLVLVGPFLTPLWMVGLVVLLRRPRLRVLGVTYLSLAVLLFMIGGKAYYLAGLYPLLLAAGAQPALDRLGRWLTGGLLVLSLPIVVLVLPVLPVAKAGPVLAMNYDAAETVGWPDVARQVAAAHRNLPPGTAIITGNYGEAGAIDRYGGNHGLPRAYSGHMAYFAWGPPPAQTRSVLAVGIPPELLRQNFSGVRPVGTLRNRQGVANEEYGTRMFACTGIKRPWPDIWHSLRSTR